MRIFEEVVSNHQEEDTGKIAIDGYFDGEEQGVIVAWVDKTGLVVPGDNAKPEYLACELVQEHIRDAVIEQLKAAAVERVERDSKLATQKISSPQEYILRLKDSISSLRSGFESLNKLLDQGNDFNIDTDDFLSQAYPFVGSLSIAELAGEVAYWEKDSGERLRDALVVPAEYVSVWDGDEERRTECKIDLMTMRVFDIGQSDDVEDLDILNEEYVETHSGNGNIYYDFHTEDGYSVVKGQRIDE